MSDQGDFFEDDDVPPLPYGPGRGEKINVAAAIFRISSKTIREKAKAFRIVYQTSPNANMLVDMPALSMVFSQDQKALDAYRKGDHTSERVRTHFANVEILTNQWVKAQRSGGK